MGFNFFGLMNQFNQFQQMLKQSKQDPQKLLEEELQKRNMSKEQLQELIQQAKLMQKLFGGK